MNEYGKNKKPFLFIIDFEIQKPLLFILDQLDPDLVKFEFNAQYELNRAGNSLGGNAVLKKYPLPFNQYRKAFDYVVAEENAGNSFLVNLTFPTLIDIDYNLEEIFIRSNARYKLWLKDDFVVFSPETFIRIEQGVISSYPMKGTIPADIQDAREIILQSKKEFAEHVTIVDLIRNDLSIVSMGVTVEKFRYLEKINTHDQPLLQVSSKITGKLPEDYPDHIGDILQKLLPAGSVSGAPKPKTLEIIRKAENMERGYYCGVMGTFDGVNLDSAVMIRYIEKTENGTYYRSGGGITVNSKPEDEYQELIDKVYLPF